MMVLEISSINSRRLSIGALLGVCLHTMADRGDRQTYCTYRPGASRNGTYSDHGVRTRR